MAWCVAGFAIIAAIFIWREWKLKKEVYDYTRNLEQSLDDILSGKKLENLNEEEDSLWGKISGKLRRANEIWRIREEENQREKKMIKELISDISHQTKTPLANLKIYQELLEREVLTEQGKEFLVSMEGQRKKLDFLLQSMVKMSRLETGMIQIQSREEDIHSTLARAVAAIVPKAEKKQISLFVECEEGLLIRHDKKWTEEAVFNILDNAVKYTDAGGRIHISVQRQEIFTKIAIADTGKGIALERQAEIFTRFYREPEVHHQEGIGVGLYLARKIIELQRGYVEVDSRVGEGAEFRLYLPNE